jgi:hypothetical protein
MSSDWLEAIPCPRCGQTLQLDEKADSALCSACSSEFRLIGHLCPFCYSYHAETEAVCVNCASALTRVCPSCQTRNWSGGEICLSCGASLDIVGLVSRYHGDATAERLNTQMRLARGLKDTEEAGSTRRMQELIVIEEARQAELDRRLSRQREQERRLLLLVGGAVVLFVVVLVVFLLLSAYG